MQFTTASRGSAEFQKQLDLLDDLIHDRRKFPVTQQAFREFLKSRETSENIEFLVDLAALRQDLVAVSTTSTSVSGCVGASTAINIETTRELQVHISTSIAVVTRTTTADLEAQLVKLYETYIKSGAPREINISGKMKAQVEKLMLDEKDIDKIFGQVEFEIKRTMILQMDVMKFMLQVSSSVLGSRARKQLILFGTICLSAAVILALYLFVSPNQFDRYHRAWLMLPVFLMLVFYVAAWNHICPASSTAGIVLYDYIRLSYVVMQDKLALKSSRKSALVGILVNLGISSMCLLLILI